MIPDPVRELDDSPDDRLATRTPRGITRPPAERGSPDENPGEAPRPRGLESPGQVSGRLPRRHRWRAVLPAGGPGALRGGVPGCPGAEPARVGLRPGVRGPLRGRLRRGSIDAPITIRALKRTLTQRYGVESIDPDTQDCLREALVPEGNRYAGHLPTVPLRTGGARAAARSRWSGRAPRGWRRPHDLALLGYEVTDLRGVGGAGRDDALRHPGVPPAAERHPGRGREDPLARRDAPDRRAAHPGARPGRAAHGRASRPSSSRSACSRAGTSPSRASSSTAS